MAYRGTGANRARLFYPWIPRNYAYIVSRSGQKRAQAALMGSGFLASLEDRPGQVL